MHYLILLCFIAIYPLSADTLKGLVSFGMTHSPLIQTAKAQKELSRLSHRASQAEQYGEINLLGDYTHYNIERTLAPLPPSAMMGGTPVTTTKDLFSVGISYSVPLFTGYAQTRQLEIDKIAASMADIQTTLTKEQLAYNIRTLYLTALAQKTLLGAQMSHSRALLKLKKQTKAEVDLGKRAEIEYLKAEADLVASRTQEEIFRANIKMTKATLAAIVGRSVGRLSPVAIKVKQPHYNAQHLIKKIFKLKKIQSEVLQVKKADKMVAKSQAASLPQIQMNAYVGKNFGEDIKSSDWDDETLWQIGIKGQYNLVDFGKRAANEEKARVARLQAAIHKQQVILDTKKLLLQSIEKIKLSYAQYIGYRSQYRVSQKSEKIEEARFKNGASTINDLLLAKSKTQFAKAKLIEGKYNYKKSLYYLDYILEKGSK